MTYIIFYKNTSPEVIAYLKTGKDKAKSVIYLEIKNIGNDFARDFEIYIDSKIEVLTKLQDIKIEFPFFQPQACLEYFVGVGHTLLGEDVQIIVKVKYKAKAPIFNFIIKKEHVYILKQKTFSYLDAADNSNLANIADILRKIEKKIK